MNSERLIQIISDITGIPAEEMGEDTLLFEELGADSLEMFKIYTEVSKELDAAFDRQSVVTALSIGKLLTIINENRLG